MLDDFYREHSSGHGNYANQVGPLSWSEVKPLLVLLIVSHLLEHLVRIEVDDVDRSQFVEDDIAHVDPGASPIQRIAEGIADGQFGRVHSTVLLDFVIVSSNLTLGFSVLVDFVDGLPGLLDFSFEDQKFDRVMLDPTAHPKEDQQCHPNRYACEKYSPELGLLQCLVVLVIGEDLTN